MDNKSALKPGGGHDIADPKLKARYDKIVGEQKWWNEYYQRTQDFSVGPAATILTDATTNKETYRKTIAVYRQQRNAPVLGMILANKLAVRKT